MGKLIKESILKNLGGRKNLPEVEIALDELDDSAAVGGVVFSTDSYVVQPLFFQGDLHFRQVLAPAPVWGVLRGTVFSCTPGPWSMKEVSSPTACGALYAEGTRR